MTQTRQKSICDLSLKVRCSYYADFLMRIFSKSFKLALYISCFWQILWGIISSQPCVIWHRPWRSLLPCKINGHANSRGSYIKLMTERLPCLVIGWSFKSILNFVTLFSASQKISNPLSVGRLQVKSLSFTLSLLIASGIWNNASFLAYEFCQLESTPFAQICNFLG